MNQQIEHDMEKQGWIRRMVTAVAEKCMAWFCQTGYHLSSPSETHMFMNYCGMGSIDGMMEAMMTESLARMKWEEEV